MKVINQRLKDATRIIFLDFEGTQTSQEIIAIGAVKAELDAKKHIKKFDEGFKIYIYTDSPIGPFIENLTGINRALLNSEGVSCKEAFVRLSKYIGNNLNHTTFMTYGNFDKKLLHNTAELNAIQNMPLIQAILEKSIDFSSVFSTFVKSEKHEQLSLSNALKLYKIPAHGKSHDPLNDAFDLMNLYEGFLSNRAINKKQYLQVLVTSPHLATPIRKVLNKIVEDGDCTLEEFLEYIDKEFI